MEWQDRVSVLFASVVLVTACGPLSSERSAVVAGIGQSTTAQGTASQQVTIKVGNAMRFDPATFEARAGQPIEVVLQNDGQIPHDFLLTQGVTTPVKIEAGGSATARATITLDRPGTYPFICSIPGHESAGMRGTITVR
jgi:nitrite reductase (NO-forming)